jgi:DNA repair exonuclease SbcCD ATPase subunit
MNRDQLREAVLGTAAWKKAGLLTESVAPVQEQEVIEEAKAEETAPEAHTCPLCESTLEEELSDEALLEHANQMAELFQEVELLAEEEATEEEAEEVDLLEGLDEDELVDVVELIEAYKMKKSKKKPAKAMDKDGESC